MIAQKIYSYLIEKLTEASTLDGGPQRKVMGDLMEDLTTFIWNEVAKEYPTLKSEIVVGSTCPYKIVDDKGNYIEESVDRHCYINDKLVLAVENKNYVDKCFMQRADGDFNLMKSGVNNNFKGIIIALQDGIAKNSYDFFMNRGNIDNVYYLADGKRNSKYEKHISRNLDKVNIDKIQKLVDDIVKIFEEYKEQDN